MRDGQELVMHESPLLVMLTGYLLQLNRKKNYTTLHTNTMKKNFKSTEIMIRYGQVNKEKKSMTLNFSKVIRVVIGYIMSVSLLISL